MFTMSCAPAGTRTAGEFYASGGTTLQAFVVKQDLASDLTPPGLRLR
jgi:hypothetical protein